MGHKSHGVPPVQCCKLLYCTYGSFLLLCSAWQSYIIFIRERHIPLCRSIPVLHSSLYVWVGTHHITGSLIKHTMQVQVQTSPCMLYCYSRRYMWQTSHRPQTKNTKYVHQSCRYLVEQTYLYLHFFLNGSVRKDRLFTCDHISPITVFRHRW